MIVVDTGFLVALLDADDRHHERCRTWLGANDEPLVVPVPVVTETCYFIERDSGPEIEADFLESFGPGETFEMIDLRPGDWTRSQTSSEPTPISPSASSTHRSWRSPNDSDRHRSPRWTTVTSPSFDQPTPPHSNCSHDVLDSAAPAAVQRTRIAYCQKHASARFSPVVHTDRHQSRRFCTSGPVDYERITTNASDGSIDRYYDPSTDQFLSIDPLLAKSGQPYAFFTADDPLNVTDPLGELGCGSLPFGGGVCHNLVQAAHKASKWWCTIDTQFTASAGKSSPVRCCDSMPSVSLRAGASEADARSLFGMPESRFHQTTSQVPLTMERAGRLDHPEATTMTTRFPAMHESANPKTYPDGYYRVYTLKVSLQTATGHRWATQGSAAQAPTLPFLVMICLESNNDGK